ncbi:MAG: hypothetical protein DYG98_06190 [Haliscomenobacteraceae bacterium CHB4]|nr:hypothetical protein [Saprospiraceae bacterium]MCE7922625.1 hypothetical protein [Haliscomenobacteraceae bacterium CHB4]
MLLDLTNWWQSLDGAAQFFWATGLISNVLFLVYLAVQFTGHHDADLVAGDADLGFAILSIRGLLAFGMFMGWTGVVALGLGASLPVALLAGVAAGLFAAWLVYKMLRLLLRLQASGNFEQYNAVGKTGTVYLPIPARGKGAGKIMAEVQGALRELEAVSEGDAIPTGTPVLVVGLDDNDVPVVEPFSLKP